jgi:hypothetical protein
MAMNGRLNCILEICCRSGSEASLHALTDQIHEDVGLERAEALQVAEWIRLNFDLAPKGSLGTFKSEVARLAREPQTPKASA